MTVRAKCQKPSDPSGSPVVGVEGYGAEELASTLATSGGGYRYFRVGSSELGPEIGENPYLWEGDMDELKVYDTSLSSDEAFIAYDQF